MMRICHIIKLNAIILCAALNSSYVRGKYFHPVEAPLLLPPLPLYSKKKVFSEYATGMSPTIFICPDVR